MAKRKRNTANVAPALAALGHEARLSVYRLLVRAGEDGLTVGEISSLTDIPASTLAHHIRSLVQAGLVIQEKRGREVLNWPDFDAMREIMSFLTSECCTGVYLRTGAA